MSYISVQYSLYDKFTLIYLCVCMCVCVSICLCMCVCMCEWAYVCSYMILTLIVCKNKFFFVYLRKSTKSLINFSYLLKNILSYFKSKILIKFTFPNCIFHENAFY